MNDSTDNAITTMGLTARILELEASLNEEREVRIDLEKRVQVLEQCEIDRVNVSAEDRNQSFEEWDEPLAKTELPPDTVDVPACRVPGCAFPTIKDGHCDNHQDENDRPFDGSATLVLDEGTIETTGKVLHLMEKLRDSLKDDP